MDKKQLIDIHLGTNRQIVGLCSEPNNAFFKVQDDLSQMIQKSDKTKYELEQARKKMEFQIRQSECPECSGKLYRGKKNKRNNYKRSFVCGDCFTIFEI